MSEMQRTSPKLCKQCKYSVGISAMEIKGKPSGCEGVACYYIVEEKKRRGCPRGWCDKFEPRKRRRKK